MALYGILNVDKPAGCSSRDVVNRVERLVRPAKAGHAGTLDPLASGVLAICVGQATRLVQYVQRMPKQYRATFLLGQVSETDDLEGQVTLLAEAPQPTRTAIENLLPRFLGRIEQRPPVYSAIKLAGRRAYELARQGRAVEPAARTVVIHSLRVEHYEYPELELSIACGSGTYIRALGRDLAAALGTSAVMSALRRTAIGGFCVEDAVPLEELTAESLPHNLQSPLAAVADLPRVTLNDEQLEDIRHGRPIRLSTHESGRNLAAEWAAVDAAGQLVAILRQKCESQHWPALNFRP